jgi:hypothetical protein
MMLLEYFLMRISTRRCREFLEMMKVPGKSFLSVERQSSKEAKKMGKRSIPGLLQ